MDIVVHNVQIAVPVRDRFYKWVSAHISSILSKGALVFMVYVGFCALSWTSVLRMSIMAFLAFAFLMNTAALNQMVTSDHGDFKEMSVVMKFYGIILLIGFNLTMSAFVGYGLKMSIYLFLGW